MIQIMHLKYTRFTILKNPVTMSSDISVLVGALFWSHIYFAISTNAIRASVNCAIKKLLVTHICIWYSLRKTFIRIEIFSKRLREKNNFRLNLISQKIKIMKKVNVFAKRSCLRREKQKIYWQWFASDINLWYNQECEEKPEMHVMFMKEICIFLK